MKNVYVVEMWSKSPQLSGDFYTQTAHYSETLEEAIDWANDHLDWGGVQGVHDDYFPWHWKIFEKPVGMDQCCTVEYGHYDPVMVINPERIVEEHHDYEDEFQDLFGAELDELLDKREGYEQWDEWREWVNDDSDETEVDETEEYGKSPFDCWVRWWESRVDWAASPTSYEAWDGAIDTVLAYLTSNLLIEDEEALKIKEKLRNDKV